MSDDDESDVARKLRELNRADQRIRRWSRAQIGYFEAHPPREAPPAEDQEAD